MIAIFAIAYASFWFSTSFPNFQTFLTWVCIKCVTAHFIPNKYENTLSFKTRPAGDVTNFQESLKPKKKEIIFIAVTQTHTHTHNIDNFIYWIFILFLILSHFLRYFLFFKYLFIRNKKNKIKCIKKIFIN